MQNQPNPSPSHHEKTARNGVWLLFAGLLVFGIVIVRFVFPEHSEASTAADNGMPDSEETYTVAKQYIRDKSGEYLQFTSEGYQFAHDADSVYTIKTETETQEDDNSRISYFVKMKYRGGPRDDQKSWSLLDMVQN